jgi:hypothetical protein
VAIAFSNLGASANPDINVDANQDSYVNSSWTPPTDGLIVACVMHKSVDESETYPSVSGNSLTWIKIDGGFIPGTFILWSVFAASASGATTGATTFDWGTVTQSHCDVSFFQITGVDLSGGVAAAFVQTPVDGAQSGTSGSVTLSAASDSANRPISFFGHRANESTTPRTNWNELDDLSGTGADRGSDTQYRDDTFETTASASWTTSEKWFGFAAEIKAEGAAGGITVDTGNITIATPVANATSPQTFSHTCGAHVKLLVVVITIYDISSTDGVVSAVTYDDDPLDEATQYYDSLCDGHVSIWWMALPTTGSSLTVSVTFGGPVTDFEAAAVGVEGTLGSFALDAAGTPQTGTTGDLVISWDAVAEASISFAAGLDDQTAAAKVTPQETEIYTVDVGDVVSAEYAIRSASGSQTMTIADADGDEDWVIVGAGFYEIAIADSIPYLTSKKKRNQQHMLVR